MKKKILQEFYSDNFDDFYKSEGIKIYHEGSALASSYYDDTFTDLYEDDPWLHDWFLNNISMNVNGGRTSPTSSLRTIIKLDISKCDMNGHIVYSDVKKIDFQIISGPSVEKLPFYGDHQYPLGQILSIWPSVRRDYLIHLILMTGHRYLEIAAKKVSFEK